MSIKYNGGYIPAVGADGTTLVANSASATGVAWAGPTFAAGKNKIINGDFGVWQRGTSFSNPVNAYTADRFLGYCSATTYTYSQQTFTAGAAPVAGYEGQFFQRVSVATLGAGSDFYIQQRVEDVRTFANQTVTFSFWAKADSARAVGIFASQNFGSGGSGSVTTQIGAGITLSTSWARYTQTITLPSISGKTIGTSSFLNIQAYGAIGAGFVFDTWGWQLEAGSVATPFTTATGTVQGELAACQRYYYNVGAGTNKPLGSSLNESTTLTYVDVYAPVTMRTAPTIVQTTGASYYLIAGSNQSGFTGIDQSTNTITELFLSTSGLTQGQARLCRSQNASGSISLSAEL